MANTAMQEYERWAARQLEDPDLGPELASIAGDADAIEERFAISLAFGTAGLRGVLGAGTNRMNIYTVRKATQGLAGYLTAQGPKPKVALGYDSRLKSELFAREAACVLAAAGVQVWLYPQLEPVPALSFAVRHLECSAGVMITASHNPAKYNGYKVYGPDGCQMSTDASGEVLARIEQLDIFNDVHTLPYERAVEDGLIRSIGSEVLEAFYEAVMTQRVHPEAASLADLPLVYTPLNGTGNIPVRTVLARAGFSQIDVVPQQEHPDGNFPTCPYPNPEVRETLSLGIELARQKNAALVMATDPDADRVGIAVRDGEGEYHLLSGNEVGVLLLDYICAGRKQAGTLPPAPVAVRSIVSTPMADAVAQSYGVEIVKVLTGFKYIGEQIALLEAKGEEKRFLFAFEESYGYLAGTHVRDKDGVVACMLIAEMAAWYHSQGTGLYEVLHSLYRRHGVYHSVVESHTFEGLAGMRVIAGLMEGLRAAPPAAIGGCEVQSVADYESGNIQNCAAGTLTPTGLPASNVLEYSLAGGHTVIVRPSGTEPKIKVYYTAKGETPEAAEAVYQRLAGDMQGRVKP